MVDLQKQLSLAQGMVAKIAVGFFDMCVQHLAASDSALHQQQLRLDLQVATSIELPHNACLRQPVVLSLTWGMLSPSSGVSMMTPWPRLHFRPSLPAWLADASRAWQSSPVLLHDYPCP